MPKAPIMHMVPDWAVDGSPFFDRRFAKGWDLGWDQGLVAGIFRGKAQLLLQMLRLRGFTISAEQEARVLACRDTAQIERWADRVLTAASLDEVLA